MGVSEGLTPIGFSISSRETSSYSHQAEKGKSSSSRVPAGRRYVDIDKYIYNIHFSFQEG